MKQFSRQPMEMTDTGLHLNKCSVMCEDGTGVLDMLHCGCHSGRAFLNFIAPWASIQPDVANLTSQKSNRQRPTWISCWNVQGLQNLSVRGSRSS